MTVTRLPKRRCLGQLEADVAAAEHDQMRRHIVELQSLHMGERPRRFEAWKIRNGNVRSDVEENLSPVSTRVPPSLRRTSSVFGATKRPDPMISSAPLAL